MNPILKKLNYSGQDPLLILNSPEEYNEVINEIGATVHSTIEGKYEFIQVFVKSLTEATGIAEEVIKALDGDGYLWICYPKGTSKKYKSDVNRNTLLDVFAPYNFEGVRQVAIDDDWSAMRIRYVDNIKTMNRKTAKSEKGKERISSQS